LFQPPAGIRNAEVHLWNLTIAADAKSKWITQLGMPSAAASTQHSIPPLVHMPPHLASSVLYGGQNFQGMWQQE
jgi:hypothetical protein